MGYRLSCDGCHCDLLEEEAVTAGRIEKLTLCPGCGEKNRALQAAIDAAQIQAAEVFEAEQRRLREESGLRTVPDA
jgi:hypothetical protein